MILKGQSRNSLNIKISSCIYKISSFLSGENTFKYLFVFRAI